MIQPSKAVFLSYASEDADAALRICELLRSSGIEVWLDQSELRGGDSWDRQIRKQIHDCSLFVPIISANTQSRPEGYFRLEWKLAVERTHLMSDRLSFLVPVVLGDIRDRDADVPDAFRAVQWTRLSSGTPSPSFAERITRLLSSGQAQQQSEDGPSPSIGTTARASSSSLGGSRSRRSMVVIPVAVAALAAAYLLIDRFLLSRHASDPVLASAPAAAKVPEKSIAVLPFVDMSEKRDQEYFSDGLSEELIDHLTRSADLKVIARTSSFQFKGKNEDVRSIAAKLGVANLLEGSVRTAGHEMRVTVQLIRASDGTHLWSQTYDRLVSDVFKVQDEIAGKVVQALNATFAGAPNAAWGAEQNTEALKALLKGDFFYNRGNAGDNDLAIEQYQRALAIDPTYALAWAKLGRVYIFGVQFGELSGHEARAKAHDALNRAVALDPNLVIAHRWLGRMYAQIDYNYPAAESEFRQAMTLDSLSPDGRKAHEDLLTFTGFRTGQFDPIITLVQQDLELNPLDAGAHWFLGAMQYFAGRFQDALASQRRVLELNPAFRGVWADSALTLLQLGDVSEALNSAQREVDELARLSALTCIYFANQRKADSDASIRVLESKYANVGAYGIALAHACRQETDAAFAWLDNAYQQRSSGLVELKVDPLAKSLRSDERFTRLLKKLDLQ